MTKLTDLYQFELPGEEELEFNPEIPEGTFSLDRPQ